MDRSAAAALADPLRRRIVLSCVKDDRAVGELAHALGVEIKRLHYHVTALTRLRLITVARVRKRGGRPIKLYRATAAAFFVPADIAVESPSTPLMRKMECAMAHTRRFQDQGILYEVSEGGELRMRAVTQSPRRGFTMAETWRKLSLSNEEADQLAGEMRNLLEKYSHRRGRSWLIHFAVCPAQVGHS